MVSAAILVLAASLAAGQAEGDAKMPDALRKQIDEQYVGEWVAKATFDGETIPEEWSVQWADGKAWLVIQVTSVNKGKKTVAAGVIGWDAVDRSLVVQMFDTNGDQGTTRWKEFSPTAWKGQGSGSYGGKKWESATTLEFRKDGVRYEDITLGKPWVSVATRKPVAPPPSQYDHLKSLEFFIGDWEAKNDQGGMTRWTFRWDLDKNVVENEIVSRGPDGKVLFSNKGTLGWDPEARRITNWCFDQAGRRQTFLWAVQDGKSWETWAPGSQDAMQVTAIDKDSWRMERKGGSLVFKRRPGA